ncbi:MAG: hypothetical protein ACHRXM_38540 [Isosphaerales bacterium]
METIRIEIPDDHKQFAVATRLWAEALAIAPKLGDDLQAKHRHRAAGRAALAGVGQGEDDPRPDEAARNRFRAQARDWFRADLGLCSKKLDTGNAKDRDVVVDALQHCKACSDLAGVRDAKALAKLPEAERKEWQALWAEARPCSSEPKDRNPERPAQALRPRRRQKLRRWADSVSGLFPSFIPPLRVHLKNDKPRRKPDATW